MLQCYFRELETLKRGAWFRKYLHAFEHHLGSEISKEWGAV
jgi:hypothetical protein